MQEKVPIFKSSWIYSRFLIHFSIRKKVAYFVFKGSSSLGKARNFNPLNQDLLTLYRRPSPIKIWPTYAVPPTTTLYPRSTYNQWSVGSSRRFLQPVEKLIPLTTTSQNGPDQPLLYFRPTYALPDQGPLITDPSIFPERGRRRGVDRLSGVNGPLRGAWPLRSMKRHYSVNSMNASNPKYVVRYAKYVQTWIFWYTDVHPPLIRLYTELWPLS